MEIHAPEAVPLLGFARAAALHEGLALFTLANAFLALFYHLSTGAIRQFIPARGDFFALAIAQVRYYTRGIFSGAPHPAQHPGSRLNALQQITYLVLLNLALPLQVGTGILMWKPQTFARVIDAFGGFGAIASVHVACAWLFGAFLVMHVYLVTTGHTPTANLKAMILGWKELDAQENKRDGEEAR